MALPRLPEFRVVDSELRRQLAARISKYALVASGYAVFAIVYAVFAFAPSRGALWAMMAFYGLF